MPVTINLSVDKTDTTTPYTIDIYDFANNIEVSGLAMTNVTAGRYSADTAATLLLNGFYSYQIYNGNFLAGVGEFYYDLATDTEVSSEEFFNSPRFDAIDAAIAAIPGGGGGGGSVPSFSFVITPVDEALAPQGDVKRISIGADSVSMANTNAKSLAVYLSNNLSTTDVANLAFNDADTEVGGALLANAIYDALFGATADKVINITAVRFDDPVKTKYFVTSIA